MRAYIYTCHIYIYILKYMHICLVYIYIHTPKGPSYDSTTPNSATSCGFCVGIGRRCCRAPRQSRPLFFHKVKQSSHCSGRFGNSMCVCVFVVFKPLY